MGLDRLRRAWQWLRPRGLRFVEVALVAGALAYVTAFLILQLSGITNPYHIEWDARVNCLPAFRYHGTGLFPHDVLVDRAVAQCPYLWRALFWVGTLFADPYTLCKVGTFVLFFVMAWHGFQLGRHFGGWVLGAATVVLLVHCNFIWDRTMGTTARSFGFPLVVAFLRYAAVKNERGVLGTLVLQAASYPSAFLFCAPAYGLTLLRPWKLDRRVWRFLVVGGVAFALAASMALFTDPKIGHPITWDELMTLRQKTSGGLYPLQSARDSIQNGLQIGLWSMNNGSHSLLLDLWSIRGSGAIVFALVAAMLARAGRRLRELPAIFPVLFFTALGVFAVAQAFPYRLYFPNRLLQFSWPPLFLVGLPLVGMLMFEDKRRGAVLTAALLCGFQLAFYGDGLEPHINVREWSRQHTPVVKYLATLPKDITVAGHPESCSGVQVFAHRQVFFSAISNISHYYPHAIELERRGEEYYRMYYAHDLETVRRFRDRNHVDYLIHDQLDFGPAALGRARWTEPWSSLAGMLIVSAPIDKLYFAHVPPEAVVFRDGTISLVDLRKL